MNDVKDHSGNLAGSNRRNNTHVLRSSTILYDGTGFFGKGGEGRGLRVYAPGAGHLRHLALPAGVLELAKTIVGACLHLALLFGTCGELRLGPGHTPAL